MLAKHVYATVKRDITENIGCSVFAHEIPILQEIHGDNNVQVWDELTHVEPVEIDSVSEFSRLEAIYGQHESKVSFVERVYGRGLSGDFESRASYKPKKLKAA